MSEISYGWDQLSQWDINHSNMYIKYKNVSTGLSKATCSYALVKKTSHGDGYVTSEAVKVDDVTNVILKEAGNP